MAPAMSASRNMRRCKMRKCFNTVSSGMRLHGEPAGRRNVTLTFR
jgi:hypothetical protein